MKGYKLFRKDNTFGGVWDMTASDGRFETFQYEVGKTYSIHESDDACLVEDALGYYKDKWFEFHEDIIDIVREYAQDCTWLCEIEALGEVRKDDYECWTDKYRIVRKLSVHEIYEPFNRGKNNIGFGNIGNDNVGDNNIGNGNHGKNNTGDGNEGDYNFGNGNKGWENIGNGNQGVGNIGNGNVGRCNSGNFNHGDFNTGNGKPEDVASQPFKVFDKEVSVDVYNQIHYPQFVIHSHFMGISEAKYFDFPWNKFKKGSDFANAMRDKALKEQKRMWLESLGEARSLDDWDREKKKFYSIPNADREKFEAVTGISRRTETIERKAKAGFLERFAERIRNGVFETPDDEYTWWKVIYDPFESEYPWSEGLKDKGDLDGN